MADLNLSVQIKAFVENASKNIRGLQSDLKKLDSQSLKKLGTSLNGIGSSISKAGKSLSLFVSGPLAAIGAGSLAAFDKQAQAIAQVEAGIKSTGQAAGFTSGELQKFASGLQNITVFGDEQILKDVTSQLLTFTNIAGPQFERTQKAALDLATRLDGDLKGATIQLGKALNDPVANLSALSRSGIQFSKDQKEMIKSLVETNRLADAQNIILKELENQYGGSAEAAAKAGLGPLKQLKNSLGDLSEEIGRVLAPTVAQISNFIRGVVQKFQSFDERTKTLVVTFGLIGAALGPALVALGGLVKVAGLASSAFGSLGTILAAITSPLGIIVAEIAALALVIGLVVQRFSDLRNAGLSTFETLQVILLDFAGFVNTALLFPLNATLKVIRTLISTANTLAGTNFPVPEFEITGFESKINELKSRVIQAASVNEDEIPNTADSLIANVQGAMSKAFDYVKGKAVESAESIATSFGITVPAAVENTNEALAKTGDSLDEIKKKPTEFQEELGKVRVKTPEQMGVTAAQSAASGLASAFTGIANGTKEAGQAFKDFAGNFLDQIAQMILQSLILKAIQSSLGGVSGGGAATGGFVSGGQIARRFAEGGPVFGPGSGTSDSIPARLSNGEFVSDAKTVRHFGTEFFANLKKMARGGVPIPSYGGTSRFAFADGGFVGGAGSDLLSSSMNDSSNSYTRFEIVNNGSGKQISDVQEARDAQGTVVSIVLDDIRRNGPVARNLGQAFGLKRGTRK